MNTFSLTPLFRHSVGFDRLDNMLTRVFDNEKNSPSYPPYNIEKVNDDQYRITMAIAGFKLEDVKIMVHGDLLSVNGEHKKVANDDEITYLNGLIDHCMYHLSTDSTTNPKRIFKRIFNDMASKDSTAPLSIKINASLIYCDYLMDKIQNQAAC